MGRSTNSDIVKNVAFIGDVKEISNQMEKQIFTPLHGWTMSDPEITEIVMVGRKKSLYADQYHKDDKCVYLVNTSEYSNGGDYWFAIFADDRSAVEEFLKDFGLDEPIEDVDSVCQTM